MCCYQEPAESWECLQAGGTEVYEFNPGIQRGVEKKRDSCFTHCVHKMQIGFRLASCCKYQRKITLTYSLSRYSSNLLEIDTFIVPLIECKMDDATKWMEALLDYWVIEKRSLLIPQFCGVKLQHVLNHLIDRDVKQDSKHFLFRSNLNMTLFKREKELFSVFKHVELLLSRIH